MSDCPLADDCPSFSERIAGMGCQYYGDRGGAEWCDHYERPISELKQQPVKPGEEVIVTVEDIHESVPASGGPKTASSSSWTGSCRTRAPSSASTG